MAPNRRSVLKSLGNAVTLTVGSGAITVSGREIEISEVDPRKKRQVLRQVKDDEDTEVLLEFAEKKKDGSLNLVSLR